MAKRTPQTPSSTREPAVATPLLDAEFANRSRDPFEQAYMGVLRTNDPLLLERGDGSVELYRDLKRDGKVFDGLQKRQLALVGVPWQVEPVDKKSPKGTADAEKVTEILKVCSFDKLCKELMEALLTGFAVAEVVWTTRDGMLVPKRIIKRAARRFKFVQADDNAPPWLHLLTRENMLTGVPVPERKFIVHRVNPEDDNPYGTGVGLQLFWPVFFKRKGIVAWNKLNDRFGSPTPHGKYPRNAGPKEKGTLAAALMAMSNDGYLMTPEGMDIALLESKLAGNVTTQQALCEYMDDWIGSVLTGQEARATGGGAMAAASKERQDVRQDLTQADSDLLSETLNETLLDWICDYNGLEPCLVYRQIKDEEDLKSQAEADKIIHDMGFDLDENTVRAKYGDGWRKRQAPKPLLPSLNQPLTPTQFAEAALQSGQQGGQQNPAQVEVEVLMTGADSTWKSLIDRVQALVEQADTLAEAQKALAQAYGGMEHDQLTKLMAAAFALAELKGLSDAQDALSGAGD